MKKLIILTIAIAGFIAGSCNTPEKDNNNKAQAETTINNEQVAEIAVGSEGEEDGKVVHLTKETFIERVWNYEKNPDNWVYEGDLPCMIDFYADWCKPCKIIAPIIEELAEEYKGKIYVYKIDTQVERELAQVFQVTSIPRVLFVPKNGQPQMSVGALPKPTFVQAIEEVLLAE
jgi:thioredoxin